MHSWLCHRPQRATPTTQTTHCRCSMSIPNFCWLPMTTGPRIQYLSHKFMSKAQYFHMTRPSKKLSIKFLGPYEILHFLATHSITLRLLDNLHTVHPVLPCLNAGTSNSESDSQSMFNPHPRQSLLMMNHNLKSPNPQLQDWQLTSCCKLLYLVCWTGYEGTDEETSWILASQNQTCFLTCCGIPLCLSSQVWSSFKSLT